MKRRVAVLISAITFLVIAGLSVTSVLRTRKEENSRRLLQEGLAASLDINVDDYPYADVFPYGYFYASLKPGMSTLQVHHIVRAYVQAWHCGDTIETYFFFGTSDDNEGNNSRFTVRFRIFYENNGNFSRIEGEDKNSNTIRLDGCEVGRLPELP